jgi:hypothetical protein
MYKNPRVFPDQLYERQSEEQFRTDKQPKNSQLIRNKQKQNATENAAGKLKGVLLLIHKCSQELQNLSNFSLKIGPIDILLCKNSLSKNGLLFHS